MRKALLRPKDRLRCVNRLGQSSAVHGAPSWRITMRCYDAQVRTTINLDDDVLEAARAVARMERRSLGVVISELVRRGLVPQQLRIDDEDGFPVFRVRPGAPPITDEMVRGALEEA